MEYPSAQRAKMNLNSVLIRFFELNIYDNFLRFGSGFLCCFQIRFRSIVLVCTQLDIEMMSRYLNWNFHYFFLEATEKEDVHDHMLPKIRG